MEIKTLTLPAATHLLLRQYANEHKISMSAAIRELLGKAKESK